MADAEGRQFTEGNEEDEGCILALGLWSADLRIGAFHHLDRRAVSEFRAASLRFLRMDISAPSLAWCRRSDFGRAVSRILSARLPGERIICLSSQYPGPIPSKRKLKRAASWSPIWPCSRWGFPCPVDYSTGGGLLPRLFTLTFATEAATAVYFLWHSPSESLSAVPPACIPDGLRGIAPCGVRTFLPRLAPGAILRPSKIVLSLGLAFREHKGRNHSCEIDSKASPSSADFEWQTALKRAALSDTTGARWFIGSPTARLLVFRRGFDPISPSL